jgi:hypothetical protein
VSGEPEAAVVEAAADHPQLILCEAALLAHG